MTKALIVYGSRYGDTVDLAEVIANVLHEKGFAEALTIKQILGDENVQLFSKHE